MSIRQQFHQVAACPVNRVFYFVFHSNWEKTASYVFVCTNMYVGRKVSFSWENVFNTNSKGFGRRFTISNQHFGNKKLRELATVCWNFVWWLLSLVLIFCVKQLSEYLISMFFLSKILLDYKKYVTLKKFGWHRAHSSTKRIKTWL